MPLQFTGPTGDRVAHYSQPYRSQHIINVIRDVYFTGGMSSFATCFNRSFPRYHDNLGVTRPEVPEAMVALVATAVMCFMSYATTPKLTCDVAILHHV